MPQSLVARLVLAGIVGFVAIQAIRPDRTNPAFEPAQAIDAGGHVPADVALVLKRSCYDCHSNTTRWPWYSHIAPMSWGMANHVKEGREAMNFSNWNTYPPKQKMKRLESMCDEVRQGKMPLGSYLLLHGDAKLSEADWRLICDWSTDESDKVGR
ncbi:MAG: heme-binding domain-containing protein [Acidobacteriota bacterium]